MEHESDGYTNCNWCVRYSHQRFGRRIGGLGNKKTSGNYLNDSIGHNTEKSSEGLRRLAVTQTPVRNSQLTLEWKTLKSKIVIIILMIIIINAKDSVEISCHVIYSEANYKHW